MTPLRPLFAFLAGVALVGGLWLVSERGAAGPGSADASSDAFERYGDGVGERVPDLDYTGVDGSRGRLSALLQAAPAVVVAMRDASCPVCRKYGRRLARLEEEYGARGVPFVFLNVNVDDDEATVRADELGDFGFDGAYVLDPDGEDVAHGLRPRTTTEVFVIDRERTLRYRGAVDDQYGIDFAKPEPREHWLRDALDAVLAGGEVAEARTFPSGCILAQGPMVAAAEAAGAAGASDVPLTFHGRASRIFQESCVACHRDGGVAPFSLERYETAYGYRGMIEYMVTEGRMPPWFAGANSTGHFANSRALSERDRADLLAWIDAGAPEGDPADAPEPPDFAEGWMIGEPDAVIDIGETQPVPAEGVVDYRYVYVKTDFDEDKWIRRMELRPTAEQVTHHVLAFIEPPNAKSPREAAPGEPVWQGGAESYFASYVPGSVGNVYPEGTAKRLPAGAWLKFQLHYTPNGEATEDRTQLAFVFADGPPETPVVTSSAVNVRIRIPPGAKDHAEVAEYTFEEPGRILSFLPHMHVRGTAFRYELVYPDGTEETILDIPRYDFNWQLSYELAEPKEVPAGTTLRATGWFDNSEDNPFNPDPTAEVRFGEQTFEEMLIGYFDWVKAEGEGDARRAEASAASTAAAAPMSATGGAR